MTTEYWPLGHLDPCDGPEPDLPLAEALALIPLRPKLPETTVQELADLLTALLLADLEQKPLTGVGDLPRGKL